MFTPYFWLGAIVIFAGIEALTFNFTSIWFSLGAVAGFFACLANFPPLWQFACFTAVSALTLALTRPLVKKLLARRPARTNADRNLGRTVQVISPIRPGRPGRVRLDGVDWKAVSDTPLEPGDACTVIALESTTLTVAPLEETTHANAPM